MELTKYTDDIYKVLISDETLLRLLHYKPTNRLDDPLSPSKPNILEKPIDELKKIIDDVIVSALKVSELDTEKKCRLLFYPGTGRSTNDNYLFSNQEYIFVAFVHLDYENIDRRNQMICDRVNQLISNKRITGMGKVLFKSRRPVNAPKDYIGYQLSYEFISENY